MSETRFMREYRKLRAQGCPARHAVTHAKRLAEGERFEWSHDGETIELERDGFNVVATISVDELADMSHYGTFTDKWSEGAIDRERFDGEGTVTSRDYRYFIPGVSIEEQRTGLRMMGFSRHAAWVTANQYVERSYRRLTRGDCCEWLLCVKVFHPETGVELARDYLGGIDASDDYTEARIYFEDMIEDILPGVISEAEATIGKIVDAHAVRTLDGASAMFSRTDDGEDS